MNILIVEDNAANFEEIVGLLNPIEENDLSEEEKAYQIVRAKNKQEALDTLKRWFNNCTNNYEQH